MWLTANCISILFVSNAHPTGPTLALGLQEDLALVPLDAGFIRGSHQIRRRGPRSEPDIRTWEPSYTVPWPGGVGSDRSIQIGRSFLMMFTPKRM